ncbi:MFS transporter multidrug-resistance type transporter [Orobanche minor]
MVYLVLGTHNMSISTSIATEVNKFVAEQGGQRLVPVGLGDDDQCIEDDFSAWRDLVCPELNKIFRGEDDATVSTSYVAAVSKYRVVFHDQSGDSVSDKTSANSYANGNVVQVNVAVTRELHAPASDRSCTHLEFDISGTRLALVIEGPFRLVAEEGKSECSRTLPVQKKAAFKLKPEIIEISPASREVERSTAALAANSDFQFALWSN